MPTLGQLRAQAKRWNREHRQVEEIGRASIATFWRGNAGRFLVTGGGDDAQTRNEIMVERIMQDLSSSALSTVIFTTHTGIEESLRQQLQDWNGAPVTYYEFGGRNRSYDVLYGMSMSAICSYLSEVAMRLGLDALRTVLPVAVEVISAYGQPNLMELERFARWTITEIRERGRRARIAESRLDVIAAHPNTLSELQTLLSYVRNSMQGITAESCESRRNLRSLLAQRNRSIIVVHVQSAEQWILNRYFYRELSEILSSGESFRWILDSMSLLEGDGLDEVLRVVMSSPLCDAGVCAENIELMLKDNQLIQSFSDHVLLLSNNGVWLSNILKSYGTYPHKEVHMGGGMHFLPHFRDFFEGHIGLGTDTRQRVDETDVAGKRVLLRHGETQIIQLATRFTIR